MATVPADPLTARDRFVDVVGRAAHAAHEARVLKTMAADAVEDGIYAVRHAVARGGREVEEWRETTAFRIKKAPLLSVAFAAGAGLLIGVLCGRWGGCGSQRGG
jgi:ElaB/YqjD/DUF883 family membrane-anchored ribosome-binding protein